MAIYTILKIYEQHELGTCPRCREPFSYIPYVHRDTGEVFPNENVGQCINQLCQHLYSYNRYNRERAKLPGIENYSLLTDYTIEDLSQCPCCDRLHSFVPYQNIETKERLPKNVGKCLHKQCSYEYDTVKFLKDNASHTQQTEMDELELHESNNN